MCILDVAIIIVIILSLVWLCTRKPDTEKFDVYNNHERGAQKVYATTGIPFDGKIEDMSLEDAGRLAKYTWNEADPLGLDVYDRYYEQFVRKNKYANQFPDTASDDIPYRDVGSGIGISDVYDTKFHVYSGIQGVDGYTNYSMTGMADPDPLYMEFNGQTVVLNQKNF